MSDQTTAFRIRVECNPYVPDTEFPIRLVVADSRDVTLTELKFTPERAHETAYSITRLLAQFIPRTDSHRLAQGLRSAAVKVWSTRN
jgi:hypothetical protein